ncbi:tail protein X [Helicobacter bizzozeronii]|uniref:tail protein X n=1 Tax=Helicobacter bizzozeronii TaxID=56877 RepID=UPI0013157BE4|nr:tail protein X [Helicobacter bizzozeronii]
MSEKKIVALQGERWDSLFFKHYGHLEQQGYTSGYNAFLLANVKLLSIDVFAGGEVVNLPILETIEEGDDIVPLWED